MREFYAVSALFQLSAPFPASVREGGDDMSNAADRLVLGIVVAAALMTSHRVDAWARQKTTNPAAPADPTSVRVRTEDAALAQLIRDATDRSATFRRLVEAIGATDGVVYVVRDRCRPPLRACLVFEIAVAGPNRILRVIVDDRTPDSGALVSIAHELQHALEVLGHRDVTSGAAMYGLFERIGMWREHSFETGAAIEVEKAVRSELRKPASSRP
jgi:hypothetical protein